MQVIYISPDNQLFHLHGKDAGREGVRLNTQLQGEQHWPFELVTTKGAFIYGADIERVNVNERMISFGIIIGGDAPHLTPYQYHLAEDHFWNGQDENRDGWLGIFTRFSGWRWIKVRPFSTVDTPQKKSPWRTTRTPPCGTSSGSRAPRSTARTRSGRCGRQA
jgi:hypothetical protein